LERLKTRVGRKKGRRCRFLQTQMVMQPEALKSASVGEIAAPLGLPVLAGVFFLAEVGAKCRPL